MLPKKFYLALDALTYIATAAGERPVGAKELTQYLSTPPRYLEPILQGLVHNDILKSTRGPRGGYLLAKERRKISAADIYYIVESIHTKDTQTHHQPHAYLQPFTAELTTVVETFLRNFSVEDCVASWRNNHGESTNPRSDFTI